MKYLGMKLDPSLTFKEHVNYVKGKTLGKIKLLGKVSSYIKSSTALMLYKSLILPIYDYGDIIYNCLSLADSKTLQVLQNMAFKFILGVPLLTPTAYIHRELEMSTLQERRTQHSATLMYQVDKAYVHHQCCDYLKSVYTYPADQQEGTLVVTLKYLGIVLKCAKEILYIEELNHGTWCHRSSRTQNLCHVSRQTFQNTGWWMGM